LDRGHFYFGLTGHFFFGPTGYFNGSPLFTHGSSFFCGETLTERYRDLPHYSHFPKAIGWFKMEKMKYLCLNAEAVL